MSELEDLKNDIVDHESAPKKVLVKLLKQKFLVFLIFCVFCIAGIKFLGWLMQVDGEKLKEEEVENIIKLDAGVSAVDMEKQAMEHVEDKVEDQKEKLEQLRETTRETQEDLQRKNFELQAQFDSLMNKIAGIEDNLNNKGNDGLQDISNNSSAEEFVQINQPKRITRYVANLTNNKNSPDYMPIKTADNYIPATTHVRGVLMHGVTAGTGVYSSSNPKPITIYLTDYGVLPRKAKSDLKDCKISASAIGELISERVEIRGEELVCTEIRTGEVVETNVSLHVVDSDGIGGVRGRVVEKGHPYLMNAQLFSTFAGVAETNMRDPTIYNPFTIGTGSVKPLSGAENLGNNMLGGLQNGMELLADFNIRRAERLEPVIEIGPGRVVDIVFDAGVFWGSSNVKQEISKKRDTAIKKAAQIESEKAVKQSILPQINAMNLD